MTTQQPVPIDGVVGCYEDLDGPVQGWCLFDVLFKKDFEFLVERIFHHPVNEFAILLQ